MQSELTGRTADHLSTTPDHAPTAMVGLDGFVDEIIRLVDKRTSTTQFTPVARLSDLASRIGAAAGLGTNIEMVVERVKLGGNGPILANAIAALGADVTCIGSLGANGIHPAFAEIADRAKLISLGEAGHTDALEFEDGKLMLGKLAGLDNITWQTLVDKLGEEEIERQFCRSDLVALVNWTMIPAMNDIWNSILALFEERGARGRFFFDLADPEKHDDESVAKACRLLSKFQKFGPTTLSVNEKEGIRVADTMGYAGGHAHGRANVCAIAQFISRQLPVETVVVHPRAYAVAASNGELTADVDGPFTDNPLISTGAGDHFGAGYCMAKLLGLPDDEALTTAVGTSGYYVRNAESPTRRQLAEFLRDQAKSTA